VNCYEIRFVQHAHLGCYTGLSVLGGKRTPYRVARNRLVSRRTRTEAHSGLAVTPIFVDIYGSHYELVFDGLKCLGFAGFSASGLAVELSHDLDSTPVHSSVPEFRFLSYSFEVRITSIPKTLPREDPDFDLRLIQPAAVTGRVVDAEVTPDFGCHFRAKARPPLAAMVSTGLSISTTPGSGNT
jgi:hypothetical protein